MRFLFLWTWLLVLRVCSADVSSREDEVGGQVFPAHVDAGVASREESDEVELFPIWIESPSAHDVLPAHVYSKGGVTYMVPLGPTQETLSVLEVVCPVVIHDEARLTDLGPLARIKIVTEFQQLLCALHTFLLATRTLAFAAPQQPYAEQLLRQAEQLWHDVDLHPLAK